LQRINGRNKFGKRRLQGTFKPPKQLHGINNGMKYRRKIVAPLNRKVLIQGIESSRMKMEELRLKISHKKEELERKKLEDYSEEFRKLDNLTAKWK
jgi:hypothetical protein